MDNNELEIWKERITTRKASGLTVSEWFQKNHFTKYKYYYWYKLINGPKLDSEISVKRTGRKTEKRALCKGSDY